jgi:hypothetical protein
MVRCEPGPKGAFLKDGKEQRFFVRGGNATTELSGAAITDYINYRSRSDIAAQSPPLKRHRLSTSREGAHHMVLDSLFANANFLGNLPVSLSP